MFPLFRSSLFSLLLAAPVLHAGFCWPIVCLLRLLCIYVSTPGRPLDHVGGPRALCSVVCLLCSSAAPGHRLDLVGGAPCSNVLLFLIYLPVAPQISDLVPTLPLCPAVACATASSNNHLPIVPAVASAPASVASVCFASTSPCWARYSLTHLPLCPVVTRTTGISSVRPPPPALVVMCVLSSPNGTAPGAPGASGGRRRSCTLGVCQSPLSCVLLPPTRHPRRGSGRLGGE